MPGTQSASVDHPIKYRTIWAAFIRSLIVLLVVALGLVVYLALNPGVLSGIIRALPIPGVVDLPTPGPTPLPPAITAPRGALPAGDPSLWGEYQNGQFGCGFLIELDGGQRVGISAAHATPRLALNSPAVFRALDGGIAVALSGQIGYGREFIKDDFTSDYAIWAVAEIGNQESVLKPDPRGQGLPGEEVVLYSPFHRPSGAPQALAGVVIKTSPGAIWVQMRDYFDPHGFSGCPVVSQYTGLVIGMAVSGADLHPVVIGLNPIGSLAAKARLALSQP